MSKYEKEANNTFRPSEPTDRIREGAKKLRKNLERTIGKRGCQCMSFTPNKKTAEVTGGPFVDMSLGLMRSTLP